MKYSIILLVLLFSCATPQKKLHKLLTKYPELKYKDTIIVRDTIPVTVPGVSGSDQVPFIKSDSCSCKISSDTARIDKDHLTARAWIINDTLYLTAECDTVYLDVPIEIPVEVETIVYRRPRDALRRIGWAILIFLCGIYVGSRHKK